jgi:HJR/Mrr/RecB family endonuclease
MNETVESLIKKGNTAFLAGKQTDVMRYFLDALKQAGAFESVVKYVYKHKEDLCENQLILHQLLSAKYHLHFVPGALLFFLINIKNLFEEMEQKEEFQRFKKLMLAKHPKTVEQIVDVFLDEYEKPSNEEKMLLSKVLKEHGLNHSIYDIERFCNLRTKAKDLNRFEQSLDWKQSNTFIEIDTMTGYEFEDFVVDLLIKLGYFVEKKKRSHEQGLDLLLIKHGVRIAVQVKRYKKPVGNRAVQQAIAARMYHSCQQALVIVNSVFTTPAKQLAARCNVELWDRTVLKEKIKQVWGPS